jgi:hypothetical protein
VFFLEESVLVIRNQEDLLDSWTDLSLIQDHLIKPGLLNGVFMNLVVCILYNYPYHLHPFLSHPNPSLHHLEGSMTLVC